MSNPPERRTSKRRPGRFFSLNGACAREHASAPGDMRADLLTGTLAAADYENDDDFVFTRKSKKVKTEEPAEPVKKPGRGRPPKRGANKENSPEAITEKETGRTQRSTRRTPATESIPEESQPKVSKKGLRKSTRLADEDQDTGQASKNGASRDHGGRKGKSKSRSATSAFDSPDGPVQSAKIALPMSDTPIINRNKEMRKKGTGNRRSSLGSRGRRASSLIDNGQTALPHREVKPAEFYKHIEADGLTEPRRMKQLLTWCGERALSEKPRHGTVNSSVIHGGTCYRALKRGG